jgi:tRNA(Ser,Leu) C12 N-acetylase TAN1
MTTVVHLDVLQKGIFVSVLEKSMKMEEKQKLQAHSPFSGRWRKNT